MFNILGLLFATANALIPGLYTLKALDQQIEFRPSSYQYLLNYWLYYILLDVLVSIVFNDWALIHLGANLIKCWLFYGGGKMNNIVLANAVVMKNCGSWAKWGEMMISQVISRMAPRFGDLNHQVHNMGMNYEQPLDGEVSVDGDAIMEQMWCLLRIFQSVLLATTATTETSLPKLSPEGGTPPKKLRKLRNVKSFTSLASRQNSHSELKNLSQEKQSSSSGYLNKFFAFNLQGRSPSPGVNLVSQKNRNVSSPAATPSFNNAMGYVNVDGEATGHAYVGKVKRRSKSGSEYDLGVPYVGPRQWQMQNPRGGERELQNQQQHQRQHQQRNSNYLLFKDAKERENGRSKQRNRGEQYTTGPISHQRSEFVQPQFEVGNSQLNHRSQPARSNGMDYRQVVPRGGDGFKVSSRAVRNVQDEVRHDDSGDNGRRRYGPVRFDELPAAPTPSMVIK
ncbi:hypothetical protein I9W82_005098 [Candida metapsilosis]|uniref:Uncharacterized protein n=1 Tax=Candida metapsilosis TaxID=273372 RepID=A0A8H7ZC03_9ASCO|nr:hypothetical protein I9W82_005098 [Candida metapsilosis]